MKYHHLCRSASDYSVALCGLRDVTHASSVKYYVTQYAPVRQSPAMCLECLVHPDLPLLTLAATEL